MFRSNIYTVVGPIRVLGHSNSNNEIVTPCRYTYRNYSKFGYFSVYSREAFIANFVTTTVNLLCNLNINLSNTINCKKRRIKVVCLLNLLVMAELVYTTIVTPNIDIFIIFISSLMMSEV